MEQVDIFAKYNIGATPVDPVSSPDGGLEPGVTPSPRLSGWDQVKDILAAPLRGAEGLVQSTYGLIDWATGDALLPDYKRRFFGESQTLVGGLLEGITQFAIGWGTTGLALKAIGAAGKLGAFGKAAGALDELAGAGFVQGAGVRGVAQTIGASTAKGALVDFWAFSGTEGRMTDVLAQYDTLREAPVVGALIDFLETEEDDTELEGRLKNVLEGAGIGLGVDALVAASKALRASARGSGDIASAAREVDEAVLKVREREKLARVKELEPELQKNGGVLEYDDEVIAQGYSAYREALLEGRMEPQARPTEIDTGTPDVGPDGTPLEVPKEVPSDKPPRIETDINGSKTKVSASLGEQVDAALKEASIVENLKAERKAKTPGPVTTWIEKEFAELRDAMTARMGDFVLSGAKTTRPGYVGAVLEKARGDIEEVANRILDRAVASDDIRYVASLVAENVDNFIDNLKRTAPDTVKDPTAMRDYLTGVRSEMMELNDLYATGDARVATDLIIEEMTKGNDEFLRIAEKQDAVRFIGISRMKKALSLAGNVLEELRTDGLPGSITEEFQAVLEQGRDLLALSDDSGFLRGFLLQARKQSSLDVRMYGIEALRRAQQGRIAKVASNAAMDRARLEQVASLAAGIDLSDERAVQKFIFGLQKSDNARKFDTFKTWYRNNLLTSPATHVLNLTSTWARTHIGSFERYIGAKVGQLVASTPDGKQAAKIAGEVAIREFQMFYTSLKDGLKAGKDAWKNNGRGALLDTPVSKMDETGRSRLDVMEVRDITNLIETGKWKDPRAWLQNWKNGALNVIMPIQSVPGRFMGSVDEAFKTITYDAAFKSEAFGAARRRGLNHEEAAKEAERLFAKSKIDGAHMVSDKAYTAKARQMAEAQLKEELGDELADKTEAEIRLLVQNKTLEIYAEINPRAKVILEADKIKQLEAEGKAPKGSYDDFLSSEVYQEEDYVFSLAREAQRRSLEVTYQRDVPNKGFGKVVNSLQAVTQEDTVLGATMSVLFPFIKTPYNVVSYSLDVATAPFRFGARSAQGLTSRVGLTKVTSAQNNLRKVIDAGLTSSDPTKQAQALEAVGRLGFGLLLATSGYIAAKSGVITGMRPVEPGEAAIWDSEGIQEYSIRVGDRYVSYARAEPLATLVGIMADLANTKNMTREEEMGIAAALATTVASNITEKTFLTSLSTFMDAAIQGDERAMSRMVNTIISPVFANPGTAAINRALFDEGTAREMRTLADAINGKLPGAAETVDPRRNILGEVIKRGEGAYAKGLSGFALVNPLYVSARKNDPVMNELLKLGRVPSLPSPRLQQVVDLRQFPSTSGKTSAFDQRNELISTLKIGGKTLRESLVELFASEQYRRYAGEPTWGEIEDPRYTMVSWVLESYREYANSVIIQENPYVLDKLKTAGLLQQAVFTRDMPARQANILFN